jgi:RHS repeat-associated protein
VRVLRLRTATPADVAVLDYLLADADGNLASIDVRFSIDNGATFRPASEYAIGGSHGTANLTTSPQGEAHVFGWDARADLAAGSYAGVLLEITPRDVRPGGTVRSAPFDLTVANRRPSLHIVAPAGGRHGSPVRIEYNLFDLDSDPIDIEVTFSIDGGATFVAATEWPPGSDGISALASSPAGVGHVFLWNAALDLPQGASAVLIDITPRDPRAGVAMRSQPFDVVIPVPGPPPPPLPPPAPSVPPPGLRIFQPYPGRGNVAFRSLVANPSNRNCDYDVQYTTDGGATWRACTMTPDSDAVQQLPASKHGFDYLHRWFAVQDLGAGVTTTARLRGTLDDGQQQSSAVLTAPFAVDTTPDPPLPVNTFQRVLPIDVTVESGNGQNGVSGHLLPEVLRVKVVDGQRRPLPGVRVLFSVINAGTTMAADVEDDPWLAPCTDALGIAGARIRPRPGSRGPLTIKATVDGVDGPAALFQHTIAGASIHQGRSNPSATVPLEYGRVYPFVFFVDGDGDPATRELTIERDRPRRLRVEITNAAIDSAEPRLATYSSLLAPGLAGAEVMVVPTVLDGVVTLRVIDPDDPAVAPLTATYTVATPAASTRIQSYSPNVRAPLRLHLRVVSGHDPATGKEQRAYPGVTLATPFRVRLVDDVGTVYTQRVTSGHIGCTTPVLDRLQIQWRAIGGTISTAAAPGTQQILDAAVDQDVYFTPTGFGGWRLVASVSGGIFDPFARTFNWVDGAGHPHCYRENAIYARPEYAFAIQPPASFGIERVGTVAIAGEVAAGDRVRIVARGLSLLGSGSPEMVEVEAVRTNGSAPPAYTGLPAAYKQSLAMARSATAGIIESGDILLLSGVPHVLPASAHRHMVLPLGWLRASVFSLQHSSPVHGRHRWRIAEGGRRSVQGTAAGTTPAEGFDGSLEIPTGELVRTVTDLSFQSRPATFLFARTYRSLLGGEGMFGRGWVSGVEEFFEVAHAWGLRYSDPHGLLFDLPGNAIPHGLFVELTQRTALTADEGAFSLMGAHRDEAHFNPDGTLHLLKDRCGNVTRFRYNERAQLVRIEDPLRRVLEITYYDDTDPVPPEVRRKVKQLKDGNRIVDYAYYSQPTDPNGRPGWLMSVQRAKAPTIVGGQEVADYRRTETYRYHPAGTVSQIINSEGQAVLTVEYHADRRVHKQTYASGTLTATYPSAGVVAIEDADGNQRTYEATPSPYVDAGTVKKVTHQMNRGVRPNAAPTSVELEYNPDGYIVLARLPGGATEEYVFDDGAASPRRHGSMLLWRQRSAGGQERVQTWTYSQRFNFVLTHVGPEGHVPTASREDFTTSYLYDHQASAGDNGNVVRITLPRTLNAVVVKNSSGTYEQRWIEENPTVRATYNGDGLITHLENQQGIVKLFKYYPASNPSGGATVAVAETNTGFIGEVVEDAQTTPARDRYTPGAPLTQAVTRVTYDGVGDVATLVDPRGVTTRVTCNDLRQLTSCEVGVTAPTTIERITEQFKYGSDGLLTSRRLMQQGAPSEAGGDVVRTDASRDPLGRIVEEKRDLGSGRQASLGYEHSSANLLKKVVLPNAKSGASAREDVEIVADELEGPFRIRLGQQQEMTLDLAPSGVPRSLTDFSGRVTAALTDAFGGVSGTRNPLQHLLRIDGDVRGRPVRAVLEEPGTGGQIADFLELRTKKDGTLSRYHRGWLAPNELPGATQTYPIADRIEGFPGMTDRQPPTRRTPLLDGGRVGAGDGRRTVDFLSNALGQRTRIVTDENYRLWFARDPLGRVRVTSDSALTTELDVERSGDLREVRVTEHSDEPQAQPDLILFNRFDRDAYGRPTRILDNLGNARRFDYLSREHVVLMTDPIGPDSTEVVNGHRVNAPGNETRMHTDARGRVRLIEASLTETGAGGGAAEQNQFNAAAKTSMALALTDGGTLSVVTDSAGNQLMYGYDDRGRLEAVVIPGSGPPTGLRSTFTYDAAGKLETVRDPNGTLVRLHYDEKNRVREIHAEQLGTGVLGPDRLTVGYDSRDRVTGGSFAAAGGYRTEFRYDTEDNVRLDAQLPRRVNSDFGGGRRRVQVRYPGGDDIAFVYDDDVDLPDRLRFVIRNSTPIVRYKYLGPQVLHGRTTGPLDLTIGFNEGGQLTKMETKGLAGGRSIVFDVVPDRLGRPTEWTRTFGTSVERREWNRDSVGRIRWETATNTGGRLPERVYTRRWFDGDSVARRIDRDVTLQGATTSTVVRFARGERGRPTQRDTTTIVSDGNGCITRDHECDYTYDFLGRLRQIVHRASGQTTGFEYDVFGRRVKATFGSDEETFVYDGWQLIEVYRNGELRERYYWGRSLDELVGVQVDATFYHVVLRPDGSVDSLVDTSGAIVQSYDYDLFGNRIVLGPDRIVTGGAPLQRVGFHGKVHDAVNSLIDCRLRWFASRLGVFLTPDPAGTVPTGNAYIFAFHDPISLTDPFGLADNAIDWWEAGWALGKTLALGALFIAGGALLVGAGLVSAPIVIVGGLALLAGTALANGLERYQQDQSLGESALGGALDTVGVSQIVQGGWQYDVATRGPIAGLTGQQRGQLLGGGVGLLALLVGGGRVWKPFHARGVRWREARNQGGAMVLKASGRPEDVVWHDQQLHLGRERSTWFRDSTPAGRPETMDDFMDAITGRLHSMPGRGAPFRESAVVRYSSVSPNGRPRGSDFVLITKNGAGNRNSIDDEFTDALFSWLDAGQLARYPQVRLAQHSHFHPPSRNPGNQGIPLSGFSYGDRRLRPDGVGWDPLYLAGDLLGFDLHFFHGPWAGRHSPTLRPFVIRIAENGAIEEFAQLTLNPLQPRPTAAELFLGQYTAKNPSLLLPNFPSQFP